MNREPQVPDVTPKSPANDSERRSTVARHSLSMAGGAALSRMTGLGRIAVAAAVLGPTFLANIYSSTSLLPGMIYQMMAGPLIAAIIIPPIVRHLDAGDRRAASRLANASLGLIFAGFGAAALVALIVSPLLVRLLVAGVPPEMESHATWAASILLAMMIPQLLLQGVTGVAIAAQQSRGSFGLPAMAQIIENFGVMGVLLVARATALHDGSADTASLEFLLTVGIGTTAATALQALAQWFGARSVGFTLHPSFHWSDPDVREILGLALPSVGTATIGTARYFALVIVAGLVPGGVIAMQIGIQFANLPVALGAQPISQALLPHLARLRAAGDPRAFAEYRSAIGMALWVAVPAMMGLVVLSHPVAHVVAFGAMANPQGINLITVAVAAYALAVGGLSVAQVAGQAAYSTRDARGAFWHATLRTVLAVPPFAVAAFWLTGTSTVWALGIGTAIAETAGAIALDRRIAAGERGDGAILRWLARDVVLAALAVAVAWGVQTAIEDRVPDGRAAGFAALVVAAAAGLVVYVGTQLMVGVPEFAGLGSRIRLPWARRGAGR